MLVDIFLRPTHFLYHAFYRRLVPAVQPSYQEREWRDKESVQIPKFINGPQLRLSATKQKNEILNSNFTQVMNFTQVSNKLTVK